jgi:D-alanyl-D-alanine carboxypeptidase
MKKTGPRRSAHVATLLLAIGALALAACGGSDAAEVRVTTPTPAPPAPTVTTALATRATPAPDTCAALARTADAYLLKVVDKNRGLPADYRPDDLQVVDARWATPGFAAASLRAPAAGAVVNLLAAAEADGVELRIRSSFRSYAEQARTFQFWIDQLGEAQARRESAPPGHSEHQMGTTADVISRSVGWELITEFGATAEGKWLNAHMVEHGFALSYPPDGEAVTGYIYEPWHIRYVGKPCAAEWRASGQVLVKFLEQLPVSR